LSLRAFYLSLRAPTRNPVRAYNWIPDQVRDDSCRVRDDKCRVRDDKTGQDGELRRLGP
jgi:hypothetical protein